MWTPATANTSELRCNGEEGKAFHPARAWHIDGKMSAVHLWKRGSSHRKQDGGAGGTNKIKTSRHHVKQENVVEQHIAKS